MDHTTIILDTAHEIYARANSTNPLGDPDSRPPAYKAIGIGLAIGSGVFIGISFVLKKVGLLRANDKYNEVAGEGYGYLKNAYWWGGMTLMILGEIFNFAAYAFTDAILVTSLGAISVVITTVLSAIFLKERLSIIGKVACFLCVVGAVIIVLNAPAESSVADIQEMQSYVIAPGFLSYTGVILIVSVFLAFWAGPRYGKKNMFTYISICSWIGGLSVVCTQGLGAAIVKQASGVSQFNHWFIYVLLVFVIGTLLTEVIFLNKALNIFNAAIVTPTYYVYFTSTTIITSAVLFRGFKGTPTEIITVVFGFLTICSGVVLLQLSKSAKDVPDTAVFAGDLDQIQTIVEQEQPETEPKADALRGTAAILRRISDARTKMEHKEFERLRQDKEMDRLATLSEDGQQGQYEWDGLRRRRTTVSSTRSRPFTAPSPAPTLHPPLGRTRPLTEEEIEEERSRQMSPGVLSSIAGTIRERARTVLVTRPILPHHESHDSSLSPMPPLPLTHMTVPGQKYNDEASPYGYGAETAYQGATSNLSMDRQVHFTGGPKPSSSMNSLAPPTPPPHGEQPRSAARRQFSFQNVFRRHQADRAQDQALPPIQDHPLRQGIRARGYSERGLRAQNTTEEETLGLVTGDSRSMPALPRYEEVSDDSREDDSDGYQNSDSKRQSRYGRGITPGEGETSDEGGEKEEEAGVFEYGSNSRRNRSRQGQGQGQGEGQGQGQGSREATPPRRLPPYRRDAPGGEDDVFL
ncbi:DUF803-domain-containing protein [Poronia punctata]|nr:DUF803-domain-containing protein [Poronia punctata]